MSYVPIGNGNYVNSKRVVSIRSYDGAKLLKEVRNRINNSDDNNRTWIQDCTKGKKKNSVIICDDGVYYVSSILINTLAERFEKYENKEFSE